jgi:hypothetical protein
MGLNSISVYRQWSGILEAFKNIAMGQSGECEQVHRFQTVAVANPLLLNVGNVIS